jgi:hypothetical protein
MKQIPLFIFRSTLVLTGLPAFADSEKKPSAEVAADVWHYEIPAGVAPKTAFEQWRAQRPPAESQKVALDGLSIPKREASMMARVAGVLNPPVTGDYAFGIVAPGMKGSERPDETELWIQNDGTGEWKLVQTTGNPNKRTGRTRMEAGVPRRFELWSMGSRQTAIEWEVVDISATDSATGKATVMLARNVIPDAAMESRKPAPDDVDGDGLRESWKSRYGLDSNDGMGPNGPWGDPDGDGLLNWQEQAAGTDPKKADVEGREGLVRWEIWRDISGKYVFDLKRDSNFPTGSHEVRFLDRLEIPTGNGDHYGARLRGLIKAPADGEYTFHLAADDGAELWLGEDEKWHGKRLIAKTNQATGSSSIGWKLTDLNGRARTLPVEQTARITLRGGRSYYIEVLQKQDTAQDHCTVAWIPPGAKEPEIIGSRHLVSWKPCPTDTDDDGLPDEWQRSCGLADAKQAAMRQAEADPDLDGATNREEWLGGTDPLSKAESPSVIDHMLTSETWTGVAGRRISNLTSEKGYPAKPTLATRIDNLDFGHEGENYGVRLRGFLTPPADGDYQFSISGNNACTLYLADSEDKFTKRIISRVEVGTRWRSFDLPGHIQSDPIPLKGGSRYYIEVIYKRGETESEQDLKYTRGASGDHSSVAWKRPGESSFAVISPGVFSPYKPDSRDLDDDDLPDEWENRHTLDPTIPSGKHGAWGDPDGDGLDNFREYQLGLNPNAIDVHGTKGLALYEAWDNFPGLLPAHREQSGLFPALCKDPRFPLHPSLREWRDTLEAPRRQGNDYGGRLRAHLIPPVSGEYRFSLAGRDVGILYLSKDGSKFKRLQVASIEHGTSMHDWEGRPGQVSPSIRLEAGKPCYIEALIARGSFYHTDDFFSIAWKPPGAEKFDLIPAKHLIAFFRDPNDQDDDDLPDDWEKRYGLDATDPLGNHGPDGDPDRDGLTNMQEYRLNSDPLNGDTDGDGVSDHDEIHVYGSNPLVKDVHPPVEHHRFRLVGGTLQGGGTWVLDEDGALTSGYRRGTLLFEFDLESPGIYALALEAGSVGSLTYVPAIPVTVSVDRTVLGHSDFPAQPVTRKWLTPWLPAGKHTVLVENRNVRANANLKILSLSLSRFEDGDSQTGIPAWLSKLIDSRNGVEGSATVSKVSPWFVEGTCRYKASVSITTGGEILPVHDNLAERWHADVPLPKDGSAAEIKFGFEDGAVIKNREVRWSVTDLADAPPVNHLRVGDSIRVTALGGTDETFSLRMGERVWEKREASDPITLTFDKPGAFLLTTKLKGSEKITTTYHVHGADFGAPLSLVAGSSRVWTPAGILHPLEVRADKAIQLTPSEENLKNGSQLKFRARLDSTVGGKLSMVARLPGDGPIVAQGVVNALRLSTASKTGDAHVINTLPDGTRVVQVSYIMDGPIPADLSIWIRLYVTDAVFTNGLTWLQLTAADFDENGVAKFNVLKAPGTGTPYVCHWVLPYADFEDVLKLRDVE